MKLESGWANRVETLDEKTAKKIDNPDIYAKNGGSLPRLPEIGEIRRPLSDAKVNLPMELDIFRLPDPKDLLRPPINAGESKINALLLKPDFMLKEKPEVREAADYQSTYEERINQTPCESDRGQWQGERGESKYIPADSETTRILNEHDLNGIVYQNGIPDFSGVSESTVEIDTMTGDRRSNFEQCDQKCAGQWNREGKEERTDWTARDVSDWRRANTFSWHERNDLKTCDLVPTKINDYFGHFGGVGEYKKANSEDGGFDE